MRDLDRVHYRSVQEAPCRLSFSNETGLALLICLTVLALFSLIGLSVALNASTEMRLGDNFEALIQSRQAALAGLSHARELLKGLVFNDLLTGPDGDYDHGPTYLVRARKHGYRNPVDWSLAVRLNVNDPTAQLSGFPDDGLINTGSCDGSNGILLIPLEGIAHTTAVPKGAGAVVTGRYFVKVSDNNGEASELSGDPSDDPFLDGDGIVIVRSLGISRTIGETVASELRFNSISVFEGRYRRRRTFDLDAPIVVQGLDVLPSGQTMFEGSSFRVLGGPANAAIVTLDLDENDGIATWQRVASQVGPDQAASIDGAGIVPSIIDMTAGMRSHPDKRLLLDSTYLSGFLHRSVRRFADSIFSGNQDWTSGASPDLGAYNPTLPLNARTQRPRVTLVVGDLSLSGDASGGGILVVQGRLRVTGRLTFTGIILVLGSGDLDLEGVGTEVRGAIYIASLPGRDGASPGGLPRLTIGGQTLVAFDRGAVTMALNLIPPVQVGFREITNSTDP